MNFLWVDANGLVLGTVAQQEYDRCCQGEITGLLLDSNGFFWLVNWFTAALSATFSTTERFYTSPSCVGPAYLTGGGLADTVYRPRFVISVRGVAGFFAPGDQQQSETIHVLSYFDTACRSLDTVATGMRFDQMRSVPPLTLNPVGPAHIEQR